MSNEGAYRGETDTAADGVRERDRSEAKRHARGDFDAVPAEVVAVGAGAASSNREVAYLDVVR